MAGMKNRLSGILGKLGNTLFEWLSGWEDKATAPGIPRKLKIGMLGVLASLIVALSLPARDDIIMCYTPAPSPTIEITDAVVTPNPTAGADTVTVRARVAIVETIHSEDYVNQAQMLLFTDTAAIEMYAVDGKFADPLEVVEGHLFVGNLPPGTTWVYLSATSSISGYGDKNLPIVITDSTESSTDKDLEPAQED